MFDARTRKRIRKTFAREAEAIGWRHDTIAALRAGKITSRPRATPKVTDALDALIAGMRDGSILNRDRRTYKPVVIRTYEHAIRKSLEPAFRGVKLSELRRADVQAFADKLRAQGLAPSTIHNRLDPLRVVCRRAIRDDVIAVDPTAGLELPRIDKQARRRRNRDRIAGTSMAERLLDALAEADRALWAVCFYCGLRIGEVRGLLWRHIDFAAGTITVERGWDDREGEIAAKSDAGHRAVPLTGRLRAELVAHKLRSGRGPDDLVFGRTATVPFARSTIHARAMRAWKDANDRLVAEAERAGREVDPGEMLRPLSAHTARHTCASYLIAAGINAKALSEYMGHSSVATTFDLYGHLLPGSIREDAAQLDAYLDRGAVVGQ